MVAWEPCEFLHTIQAKPTASTQIVAVAVVQVTAGAARVQRDDATVHNRIAVDTAMINASQACIFAGGQPPT